MTSRHTTVIQYSTNGIAKALSKLGYETKILIEKNDMQLLYQDLRVKEMNDVPIHVRERDIVFSFDRSFTDKEQVFL